MISSQTRAAIVAGFVGYCISVSAYCLEAPQTEEGQQSAPVNPPSQNDAAPPPAVNPPSVDNAASPPVENSQPKKEVVTSPGKTANEVSQSPPPTVGQAPEVKSTGRPLAIAQIFEQPGVLTPRKEISIEPSLQYSYASNNRVVLVGYTVIPAILIGLIDVKNVNRVTLVAALTARYGVTNRFEVEAKVPYVYRDDTTVSRSLGSGTNQDTALSVTGKGLGDVEFTARWQMNDGGGDSPFYISSLRVKTHTGKSPFQVAIDANNLEESLPTGSGFYGIQPGLTAIFPSDPAVFFGGISYQFNLQRSADSLGGKFVGTIDPGDILDVNFGMGLAINEKASFSIGYDHAIIGKDIQNGVVAPSATVTQLGSLLIGYSYQLSDKRSVNLSMAAGLTQDTPDMQLTLRWPTNF